MLILRKIPKKRKVSQELPREQWIHVQVRTDTFTWTEWPEQELLSSAKFSIGEEQSSSTVTWLAWSAPGLAKHGRSVLAVLTSNHVLSLWASKSDMATPASWERIYVVNNPIKATLSKEHFGARFTDRTNPRLSRVRSAAWAPLLDLSHTSQRDGTTAVGVLTAGSASHATNEVYRPGDDDMNEGSVCEWYSLPRPSQLLGIANDCGGIYIVKVSSPFVNSVTAWKITMVETCCLPTQDHMTEVTPRKLPGDDFVYQSMIEHQDVDELNDTRRSTARPSLLTTALASTNFIEVISWSPWRRERGVIRGRNIITIKRNGVLSEIALLVTPEQDRIRCYFSRIRTRKRDMLEAAQRFPLWIHEVCLLLYCVLD